MRGIAVLWMALLGSGCAAKSGPVYGNGVYRLAAGLTAKEACSCLWVSGLGETECRELVRLTPDVARFRVDDEAQEVKARALFARAVARYGDAQHGCELVDR
ncbi:MAG: hypothetical protein KTR31_17380 [Myxococcales bacterium]|nr:hypothetical protein [Myxococcales bacterium]